MHKQQRYDELAGGSTSLLMSELEHTDEATIFDVDVSDLGEASTGECNRRDSPRVPFFARIELPWHPSRVVRGRDISQGGLSVMCRDGRLAYRPTEQVHIKFRMPGGDFVTAQARVVSQREAGNDLKLGLRFTSLTKEGSVSIYQLIRARS